MRYQLRHAPGLCRSVAASASEAAGCEDGGVQRLALTGLFGTIALALGAVAVWAALEGGRAWVIALTSAALALWMADLARKVAPTRRE